MARFLVAFPTSHTFLLALHPWLV